MKRSLKNVANSYGSEQQSSKKVASDFHALLKKDFPEMRNTRDNSTADTSITLDSLPTDMKHLGGENFVSVNYFLGHTRVHIRRHAADENGFFHPTKDGVSLSPKVWYSLCCELNGIINHKLNDKVFVIDSDLSVSKQVKDNVQLYVFQRLYQRRNLSMQFIPEYVVLRCPEMLKLSDSMSIISELVKDELITETLPYFIANELKNPNIDLKPSYNPDGFLQLMQSLTKCLLEAITLKINELLICSGCREAYEEDFMHVCKMTSRSEKWEEYFELAFYSVNMNELAKDLIKKNLNIDFDIVLYQQEFFDSLIVNELLKSIKKTYITEEEERDSDDSILC